jgi:hypothetical protein
LKASRRRARPVKRRMKGRWESSDAERLRLVVLFSQEYSGEVRLIASD